MARDARLVIRARQRQKQREKVHGGKVSSGNIFDARQIIKSRMKQKTHPNKNQSLNVVKKQFNTSFAQKKNSQNRFSAQNLRRNLGMNQGNVAPKKVFMGKSGILKITSRPKTVDNHQLNTSGKCIVSDESGITVTMKNKPSTAGVRFNDRMEEDDDLERMTVQDFPEMRALKTPSHHIFSSRTTTPSSTSLFSRLHSGPERTMVADTVSVASASNNQSGWKVLVTNLDPTVSEQDIFELFSSIGNVKSAGLVRPGFAVVEYFSKLEALLACEEYHNRLLDGKPMQCTIDGESQNSRPPISMRLGGKTSLIATPHFGRQTASSIFSESPRNMATITSKGVEFTVKVP